MSLVTIAAGWVLAALIFCAGYFVGRTFGSQAVTP